MITEQKFDELEHVLYGVNYQVFLRLYRNSEPVRSSEKAIQAIFPDAVIGNIVSVTAAEVFSEVDQDIRYVGDDSSGPPSGCLEADRGRMLSEEFMACVRDVVSSACKIELFWLKKGHPAYPVWWDFAFLMSNDQGSAILMGSSSD